MADTFKGRVSMTPIVTLSADADSDTTDVIHHDIKQTLSGKLEMSADNPYIAGTPRWYYSASTNFGLAGATLMTGTYTDGTALAAGDKPLMIYIRNLGTNSANETVDTSFAFTANVTCPDNREKSIWIYNNESWIGKWRPSQLDGGGPDLDSFYGDAILRTTGTDVNVEILAFVEDVG